MRLLSGSRTATKLCDSPGAPDVVPGRLFGALRGLVCLLAKRKSRVRSPGVCLGKPLYMSKGVPMNRTERYATDPTLGLVRMTCVQRHTRGTLG